MGKLWKLGAAILVAVGIITVVPAAAAPPTPGAKHIGHRATAPVAKKVTPKGHTGHRAKRVPKGHKGHRGHRVKAAPKGHKGHRGHRATRPAPKGHQGHRGHRGHRSSR